MIQSLFLTTRNSASISPRVRHGPVIRYGSLTSCWEVFRLNQTWRHPSRLRSLVLSGRRNGLSLHFTTT
jgi:hypothetical protein